MVPGLHLFTPTTTPPPLSRGWEPVLSKVTPLWIKEHPVFECGRKIRQHFCTKKKFKKRKKNASNKISLLS